MAGRSGQEVGWKRGFAEFIYSMNLMFVEPSTIVPFIKKNPTRCKGVSKCYYSIFVWSSACFGRHTAHHQKPKTALTSSGFLYVEGCWTCSWWTLSGTVPVSVQQPHVQHPSTYAKPEAASAVLGFWWWAVCRPKHVELHINMEIINFYTKLYLVGFYVWILLWCTNPRTSSSSRLDLVDCLLSNKVLS
jgi:hypothetical protein